MPGCERRQVFETFVPPLTSLLRCSLVAGDAGGQKEENNPVRVDILQKLKSIYRIGRRKNALYILRACRVPAGVGGLHGDPR